MARRKAVSEQAETLVMDSIIDADEWVQEVADDAIVECRGWGHDFPKLRIRRNRGGEARLPRGISFEPRQRDGAIQLVSKCPNCGAKRMVTTESGYLPDDARYDYDYSEVRGNGYAAPKGAGVTRRQCRSEAFRRSYEALEAANLLPV